MKYILKNKKGGFTIVETLFSVSIFLLIVIALTLFSKNILMYTSSVSTELNDLSTGRSALKTMALEIRTASSGNDGAYAVSQVSATSFTFYSDIYDNGLKEKVRYFKNGTTLQKGVIIPTGSPLAYTGTEVITTIASSVTNSTIFDYYDKNYDGTTAALTSPVDASAVRLVKITITIEENAYRSPSPITVSTQVSMRNIKDNL